VARGEVGEALSMILPQTGDVDADIDALRSFNEHAALRGVDVSATWVVESAGLLTWAILPVVSPGKTMLFLCPAVVTINEADAVALFEKACAHHAGAGVVLAQVLIEPAQRDLLRVVGLAGFKPLAELIYLYTDVKPIPRPVDLPPGFTWATYTPETRPLFARAIESSYEGSLDCPGLNHLRDIEDVIDGHMATGEFDPGLWLVLCEQDEPRGVLLLAKSEAARCVELVYVGLTIPARGRGLGRVMMRQALLSTRSTGYERMTLAVDSKNQPALRLYYRHGMKKLLTKVALVRELGARAVG